MMIQKHLFDKYLHLLGVERSFPSYQMLCQIIKAHLTKVPFENISKLLYKKQGLNYIPDLPTYLDGIEKYKFGGTCYANNYFLYLLLNDLGYDIKLCGADMKNPDVHLISIVKIKNQEYIVDGGYAAPFLNPLPIDLKEDYIINLGLEKYIIKPKDDAGRTKVEQYYDGKLQHWYTAKPRERLIEEFDKVIKDSYSDDAIFMNAIRITKFSEAGSVVIKNLSLTETINNESSTVKITLKDMPFIIQEKFGIPAEVVYKAIGHFKELRDIYD
jgi:N-hydroxyarylamine O-acetyltransferase